MRVAVWEMVVGRLRSEELPELATGALVRGMDSPSLRVLAGQSRSDVRESRDLFVAAVSELGIVVPGQDEAAWGLVRYTCRAILDGRVAPDHGAWLVSRVYEEFLTEGGDLGVFYRLLLDWEEYPSEREALEAQLRAEARELLGRAEPRRWLVLEASGEQDPLCRPGYRGSVPVATSELPVGREVQGAVERWNGRYRAIIEGWPTRGGFRDKAAVAAFAEEGRLLAQRLQSALGAGFHLEYRPIVTAGPRTQLARPTRRGWWRASDRSDRGGLR